MSKNIKKLIAPIVITVLIVLYFIFYMRIGLIFVDELPLILKIILIIVPLCLMILAVYMLYERIQEIKGGEEDDLSKY